MQTRAIFLKLFVLSALFIIDAQITYACPTTDTPLKKCTLNEDSRFQLIKQAIILTETAGKDCSQTGCPSLTVTPWHTPASYGPTQDLVANTVEKLLKRVRAQDASLAAFGFTEAELQAAMVRARAAQAWYYQIYIPVYKKGKGKRLLYRTPNPHNTLGKDPKSFMNETNLSADDFNRLEIWRQIMRIADPIRRRRGKLHGKPTRAEKAWLAPLLSKVGMTQRDLNPYLSSKHWEEANGSLQAKAIFSDKALQDKLMRYFKSEDISQGNDGTIKQSLHLYSKDPKYKQESEEDWAARVGYDHNHGYKKAADKPMKRVRADPYVANLKRHGVVVHYGFLHWWQQAYYRFCKGLLAALERLWASWA